MIKTEDGHVYAEGTVPTLCADLAAVIAAIKETAMEDAEKIGTDPETADETSNEILTATYFFAIEEGRKNREKHRKEAGKE